MLLVRVGGALSILTKLLLFLPGAGLRVLGKINDFVAVVARVYDDYGHSWLGLVSLMAFWMVCICPEEAMFEIWLTSVECEDIKNGLEDFFFKRYIFA